MNESEAIKLVTAYLGTRRAFLTVTEYADITRQSPEYVRERLRAGEIRSVRSGPRGKHRIPVTEVTHA